MRRLLDIDLLIIIGLMAVSVRMVGDYLAQFHLGAFGYLQAAAMDAVIWRSTWYARRYTGGRQRRWSLAGMCFFTLIQALFHFGYFQANAAGEPLPLRVAMATFIPVGLGLLGYLYGIRDTSALGVKREKAPAPVVVAQPEPEPTTVYNVDDRSYAVVDESPQAVARQMREAGESWRRIAATLAVSESTARRMYKAAAP